MTVLAQTKQFLSDNFPDLWNDYLNGDESSIKAVQLFDLQSKLRKDERHDMISIEIYINAMLCEISKSYDIKDIVKKYCDKNKKLKMFIRDYEKHSTEFINFN